MSKITVTVSKTVQERRFEPFSSSITIEKEIEIEDNKKLAKISLEMEAEIEKTIDKIIDKRLYKEEEDE